MGSCLAKPFRAGGPVVPKTEQVGDHDSPRMERSPSVVRGLHRGNDEKEFQAEMSVSAFHYPMHITPVQIIMDAKVLPSHGQLMAAKRIFEPKYEDAVHFVSHQWLGFTAPDPGNVQLHRLQSVFGTIAMGNVESLFNETEWKAFTTNISQGTHHSAAQQEEAAVSTSRTADSVRNDIIDGMCWMDFCSIPQLCDPADDLNVVMEEQISAIRSIPAYVERADYFWILTPNARHTVTGSLCNFNSWRKRGWCRMEEWTNTLAQKRKMPLVISSKQKLSTIGQMDHISSHFGKLDKAVCTGDFSCCRLGHEIDGRPIPCDKELLGPVLSKLYTQKLNCFLELGHTSVLYKLLYFLNPVFLAGSPLQPPDPSPDESVDDFLERIGHSSLDDGDAMSFAFMTGHTELTKKVATLRSDLVMTPSKAGITLLMIASRRYDDDLAQILDAGIGLESAETISAATGSGITALHFASGGGFPRSVAALLRYGAPMEVKRKDNGYTPLLSAAANGYPECVKVLLQHRADPGATSSDGSTGLHLAADPLSVVGCADEFAKVQVITALLEASTNPMAESDAGFMALHVAIREDFAEAAQVLAQVSYDGECFLV